MKPLRLLFAATTIGLTSATFAQRTEIANVAQPQLSVSSDGRVWLVYGQLGEAPPAPTHGDGQKHHGHGPRPDRAGDVFVAVSMDGGAMFSPGIKVSQLSKLMLGRRRGPRLVAHGDRITVAVIGHELFALTSTDGGNTWNQPVTINDVPSSAREGLHDLAGSPSGEVFATWLDLRNGTMELWGASSRDGGRTWSNNQQVYKSPDKSICECCHPTALFDAEGNLAVMWRNSMEGSRDMWMATRPKGTAKFTTPRKLGKGTWKLNGCPMDGGRLVALGGGKFGAVWQRSGEVFLTSAEEAEISLGQGKQPVAVQVGGKPVVVWQQGTDLVVRRGAQTEVSKHAADAFFPSVVALPGGKEVLVAYERGDLKSGTSIVVERL